MPGNLDAMTGVWTGGTTVVLQELWHGKLWSARPVIVAQDQPERLALWCPEGTPVKGPIAPWRPGRAAGADFFVGMFTHQDWLFGDFIWPTSNLMLVRPGDWHGVWVSWTRTGAKMGWYVNFQRPFTRTERGIQTMDLMLDLIVAQDMRWEWKDRHEFDALAGRNIITEDEARHVQEEASVVMHHIRANQPPFCEPWHDWRPDPSWSVPQLPKDWDRL